MDPRPGYLTTEFWTTIGMHLITIVTLFNVNLSTDKLSALVPVAALVASAVAQAFYSHSRGTVKNSANQAAGAVVSAQTYAAAPMDVPPSV